MLFYDHATFTCPSCSEKILVSAIPNQGFTKRLESPAPFPCPSCHKQIVFNKQSSRWFKSGVIIALFVATPVGVLFPKVPVSIVWFLFLFGICAICYALLSQRLKVHEQ